MLLDHLVSVSPQAYNEASGTAFAPYQLTNTEAEEKTFYLCTCVWSLMTAHASCVRTPLPRVRPVNLTHFRCGHSKKRTEHGIPLCDGSHKKLTQQ